MFSGAIYYNILPRRLDYNKRRDARVVEWAALERRCTRKCTEGSNPSLSAILRIIHYKDIHVGSTRLRSMVMEGYWYTGGAHGNTGYSTWTYDSVSGTVYRLEDIFTSGKVPLQLLHSLVKEQLQRKLPHADPAWIDEGTGTQKTAIPFTLLRDKLKLALIT